MSLKPIRYICHRCGKGHCNDNNGNHHRVVGPAIGQMLTEQLGCKECQDGHNEMFEARFWKGATAQPRYKCAKCGDMLTNQIGGMVPHRLQEDRTWAYAILCKVCHALYVELCQEASKNRGK